MAGTLGIRTVAEGVEDEETRLALTAAGCSLIQGWIAAHPMSPDEVAGWLAAKHPYAYGSDIRRRMPAIIGGMELWNNPSCSKCAAARDTLDAAQVPYRLRFYLEHPPTAAELTGVLRRLRLPPWEICRLSEPAAQRRGMAEWPRDESHARQWIDAMVESPELIQRPILLLDDGSAVVGRTRESLNEAVRRSAYRTREANREAGGRPAGAE